VAAPAPVERLPAASGTHVEAAPKPDTAVEAPEKPPLPDQVENWLAKLDKLPEPPPVDLDWRQRWHATNAVVPPQPDRRSGVRLRLLGLGEQSYTHVERVQRRWLRRMFWMTVALVLVLAALIAGPASVAASLDMWSQIDEQFTPPPPPPLPAPARLRVPSPLLPLAPPEL
jgi:hypothetical protein